MASTVKERYESLRKKFDLPRFEDIEEFHVSCIEETDFLLSEIRCRLIEKVQDSIEFLSDIFQPEASITNMYESMVFGEEEKKAAFDAFRRLMFWNRAALKASIIGDEKAEAEFIKGFVGDWKGLKAQLVEVVEKARVSWETDSEQSEKLGYFG